MNNRLRVVLGSVLLLSALSFFLGRVVEQRALAIHSRSLDEQAPAPTPPSTPEPPTYRELTAADIIALPFGEFYEALRSAPDEAREKWRVDLEKMPVGPRRNAAVAGFYKLLVQFEPVIAAKNAAELADKELRSLALDSVLGAAPGFALKDIATIFLKLPADASYYRNYLSEVIGQWMLVDPVAVAQFYDAHPEILEQGGFDHELTTAWAAIDPQATMEWLNAHHYGPGVLGDYLMGLYLNDRRTAIDFAIEHADELTLSAGLGYLISTLYLDSKEETKEFIERLPNDELRHNAFRGFEMAVQFGTAEETGEPERTPRAIADWMVQFPPEYWRGHLAEVLDHWNDNASQELFAWIEQQPAAIRSAVASEYKKPVGKPTLDVVSDLLLYANANLRDQLFIAMFKNSASDMSQMKETITGSSLPAAQKEYVLEIAAKAEVDIEEKRAKERAADNQGSEK